MKQTLTATAALLLATSAMLAADAPQAAMGQAQTVHVEAEEVVKHVRQTYADDASARGRG